MHSIRRRTKRLFLRLIAAKGHPWQLAAGVSVGIFWGLSPLWGLQMIMAVITATALNVSRIPAAILVHITNPLTVWLIYPLTWKLGDRVLAPFVGNGVPLESGGPFTLTSLAGLAGGALLRLIVGGCIAGFFLGAAAYPFSYCAARLLRQRIKDTRQARRARRIAAYMAEKSAAERPAEQESDQPAETVERRA